MEASLIFSLNLNSMQQENVFLHMEGQMPIEMKVSPQSKPQNFIYEVKDSIPPPYEFPKYIAYNYVVNGANLYQTNQCLAISKQPLSSIIHINDKKEPKDGSNNITLTFYISLPNNISNGSLFLMADSPVFEIPNNSYFELKRVRDSKVWAVTTQISVFLNQPIIYKYVICDSNGNEKTKEIGKPHVIFIHSPIAYKNIVIYDVWSNFIPYLSFYPHLIKPSEASLLQSSVKIEYIPEFQVKKAYLQIQNSENLEMFSDCGVWRRDQQLPSNFENFTFDICTTNDLASNNIINNSNPIFKIHHAYKDVKQDQYVSNLFFGDPFNSKLIGIYIPLISIVSDNSRCVGDFSSLVNLSKWCKQCGIDLLNIHIEQIKEGLIDPIHSCIQIENEHDIFQQASPSNKINAIRNEKLKYLWYKYKKWEIGKDKEFELFKICNPYILEKCSNDNFSLFVQYTLFKELSMAFAQVVDIGIQIILDLDIDLTVDLTSLIRIYSRYAQGIRIVGLSRYIDSLTIRDIKQSFDQPDSRMFNFVMQNFCAPDQHPISLSSSNDQPIVLLKTCYSESVIQSVEPFYKSIDPDFPSKLESLKTKYLNSENSKILINNLSRIVTDCPSSIFLDNETTAKIGWENVKSMKIIPCSQDNSSLMPNFLSPEKVSEFNQNVDVSSEINRRIKSNAKIVIVYFLDFLKAMSDGEDGHEIQVKPIQLLKNYCRCTFGISISDLLSNQKLNQKIHNVLSTAKSCI